MMYSSSQSSFADQCRWYLQTPRDSHDGNGTPATPPLEALNGLGASFQVGPDMVSTGTQRHFLSRIESPR